MQIYLTNEQEREADRNAISSGTPSEILMHRAAEAIAGEVKSAAKRIGAKKILVVCGNGNNGGDGYAVARELTDTSGLSVAVYCFEGNTSSDCRREKERYGGGYTRTVSGDIIVDCIFGTGLNKEVEGEYAAVITEINESGAYVISADIPSGLNGNNGQVMGVAVKADMTVAVSHLKTGFILGNGIDYCGSVILKDIGIQAEGAFVNAFEDGEISKLFPVRKRNTHKGDYGSACIIAGSEEFLGASVMGVAAALRSGCGYVYAVVPKQLKYALAVAYPQGIYVNEPDLHADAIAVGSGMGCTKQTYGTVCKLLNEYRGKLIIDADGLNALAEFGKDVLKTAKAQVLLTPHVGEMARLVGLTKAEVLSDPVKVAQSFAKEYNVTVHLKNAVSVTCDGKTITATLRGSTALAKAGSGDMLAGLIAGGCARGLSVYESAVSSQYVLGLAAEICSAEMYGGSVTFDDLITKLPIAINSLTR